MARENGNGHLVHQTGTERSVWTVDGFKRALVDNLYYTRGQGAPTASTYDIYVALAYTIRDYLMDRWRHTIETYAELRPRFVYYLSAEYLPGRQITQNMLYSETTDLARQALGEMGFDLDELIAQEPEPALGNGGLGRLAACYFDSLATLNIPSVSYGIHYEFGIFQQSFKDGWQEESPDEWLYYGNPWEFPHPDNQVVVGFGGRSERWQDASGRPRFRWVPAETVLGEPSHMLVPGYNTKTVNMLRLWRAKASKQFDFQLFDVGDYARAAEQKISSENISKVLYPNDNTAQGRELRLRQEYFFATCSLHDIIRRFRSFHTRWDEFPEKVVIQLNDTHPVVVIPELMRLLLDEHDMEWEQVWAITQQVFAYTCHTLLPEALEKWPVTLFERLLPRHLEIIYEINARFLEEVEARFPGDADLLARVSIIEEWPQRSVRMAHLATIACFSVNGVSALHTDLLKHQLLRDFYELWPEKFNNKTNGVSPRRFMRLSNPRLSSLISETIGQEWPNDLEQLRQLEARADDPAFRAAWHQVKQHNKEQLAQIILMRTGVQVDPNSMYDVMVKRLHEYKRQLLKTLHIITLYNRIKNGQAGDIVPHTFIFGAKAAPGYRMAKLIIKLINSVGSVINKDPQVGDLLKVVFLPNFNVTLGESIYPAANLSEQISLAGKEASGTGNMKFALNGALTIGTLDGANIEIRERVGAENFFLFGLTAEEATMIKSKRIDPQQINNPTVRALVAQTGGYRSLDVYNRHAELKQAIDRISQGGFSEGIPEMFRSITDALLYHDEFLHLADYPSYLDCQARVDQTYLDREAWTRMSILNSARCGYFSSDRAIREYCEDIWKVKPVDL